MIDDFESAGNPADVVIDLLTRHGRINRSNNRASDTAPSHDKGWSVKSLLGYVKGLLESDNGNRLLFHVPEVGFNGSLSGPSVQIATLGDLAVELLHTVGVVRTLRAKIVATAQRTAGAHSRYARIIGRCWKRRRQRLGEQRPRFERGHSRTIDVYQLMMIQCRSALISVQHTWRVVWTLQSRELRSTGVAEYLSPGLQYLIFLFLVGTLFRNAETPLAIAGALLNIQTIGAPALPAVPLRT